MDFIIDLNTKPEPIPVRVGAATFHLHHRFFTAYEASRVIDCLQIGLESAIMASHHAIESWSGVKDASGVDIPMKFKHADGREESKLDVVLGRIPFIEQLAVFFRQLAVNGISYNEAVMRETVRKYMKDSKCVDAFVEDIDLFFSRGRSAPAAPSGSSSGTATSPAPSA